MSLLIKGGDVVDGSGNPPQKKDILLIGGRIAAIGELASYKADKVIHVPGSFVCPGFIDVSSTSDINLSLFKEPKQSDFLKDGVTTIICGSKGKSLAPAMYANQVPSANVGWTTIHDYLDAISNIRPGINFATLTGYETVRKNIVSKPRNIGKKEINVLSHLLSQCLDEGSLGISINDKGLIGFNASEEEISTIIRIIKKSRKTLLASLLTEAKISKQADEIMIFIENGVKTIINELNKNLKNTIAFNKLIKSIENKTPKAEFSFIVSPYPYYSFQASELFPESADIKNTESALKSLEKKRTLSSFSKKVAEIDAQNTFIWSSLSQKASNFFTGKSIAKFAENRGIKPAEALINIIKITGINTTFVTKTSNKSVIDKILLHPKSIIGSSMWSPMSDLSEIHSKLSSPFTEFINRSNSLGLPIESVIKKACAPARILELEKTGLIKEGYSADITIIKDNIPEKTIVKGNLSIEKGVVTENRKGEIIRR